MPNRKPWCELVQLAVVSSVRDDAGCAGFHHADGAFAATIAGIAVIISTLVSVAATRVIAVIAPAATTGRKHNSHDTKDRQSTAYDHGNHSFIPGGETAKSVHQRFRGATERWPIVTPNGLHVSVEVCAAIEPNQSETVAMKIFSFSARQDVLAMRSRPEGGLIHGGLHDSLSVLHASS
jgi:hypothetical protein